MWFDVVREENWATENCGDLESEKNFAHPAGTVLEETGLGQATK